MASGENCSMKSKSDLTLGIYYALKKKLSVVFMHTPLFMENKQINAYNSASELKAIKLDVK